MMYSGGGSKSAPPIAISESDKKKNRVSYGIDAKKKLVHVVEGLKEMYPVSNKDDKSAL